MLVDENLALVERVRGLEGKGSWLFFWVYMI